ncbi:MAG: hypothetical protein GW859_09065 [Sphingomonadales bacterium]|nr:hypothetical protein [Sphingomonadales bacterium]
MTEDTKQTPDDTADTADAAEAPRPVEDRPNVGTTSPDAYPKDEDAGPGSGGGGKPDYGSPKR